MTLRANLESIVSIILIAAGFFWLIFGNALTEIREYAEILNGDPVARIVRAVSGQ